MSFVQAFVAVGLARDGIVAVSLAEALIKALAPEGIVAVADVLFVQAFVAVGLARDGIVAVLLAEALIKALAQEGMGVELGWLL